MLFYMRQLIKPFRLALIYIHRLPENMTKHSNGRRERAVPGASKGDGSAVRSIFGDLADEESLLMTRIVEEETAGVALSMILSPSLPLPTARDVCKSSVSLNEGALHSDEISAVRGRSDQHTGAGCSGSHAAGLHSTPHCGSFADHSSSSSASTPSSSSSAFSSSSFSSSSSASSSSSSSSSVSSSSFFSPSSLPSQSSSRARARAEAAGRGKGSVGNPRVCERWVPWCGLLLDTCNLEVRADYQRLAHTFMADTLTVKCRQVRIRFIAITTTILTV